MWTNKGVLEGYTGTPKPPIEFPGRDITYISIRDTLDLRKLDLCTTLESGKVDQPDLGINN